MKTLVWMVRGNTDLLAIYLMVAAFVLAAMIHFQLATMDFNAWMELLVDPFSISEVVKASVVESSDFSDCVKLEFGKGERKVLCWPSLN